MFVVSRCFGYRDYPFQSRFTFEKLKEVVYSLYFCLAVKFPFHIYIYTCDCVQVNRERGYLCCLGMHVTVCRSRMGQLSLSQSHSNSDVHVLGTVAPDFGLWLIEWALTVNSFVYKRWRLVALPEPAVKTKAIVQIASCEACSRQQCLLVFILLTFAVKDISLHPPGCLSNIIRVSA